MLINNASDLTRALRQGPYAWPGGYPVIWVMTDGNIICPSCAKVNRALLRLSLRNNSRDNGWHPAAIDLYLEGPAVHCDQCNRLIESAYGDPDAPETDTETEG